MMETPTLILLDRDGVINTNLPQSVLKPEDFVFLPGSLEAVAMLTRARIPLVLCTNQSCVGRGLISQAALDQIHDRMLAQIRAAGGDIARIYAATDAPDNASNRRKPGDGMLREALRDFAVDAPHALMIGDSLRDIQAAHRAGCSRMLVRSGNGQAVVDAGIPDELQPVIVVEDLRAAAQRILEA